MRRNPDLEIRLRRLGVLPGPPIVRVRRRYRLGLHRHIQQRVLQFPPRSRQSHGHLTGLGPEGFHHETLVVIGKERYLGGGIDSDGESAQQVTFDRGNHTLGQIVQVGNIFWNGEHVKDAFWNSEVHEQDRVTLGPGHPANDTPGVVREEPDFRKQDGRVIAPGIVQARSVSGSISVDIVLDSDLAPGTIQFGDILRSPFPARPLKAPR